MSDENAVVHRCTLECGHFHLVLDSRYDADEVRFMIGDISNCDVCPGDPYRQIVNVEIVPDDQYREPPSELAWARQQQVEETNRDRP